MTYHTQGWSIPVSLSSSDFKYSSSYKVRVATKGRRGGDICGGERPQRGKILNLSSPGKGWQEKSQNFPRRGRVGEEKSQNFPRRGMSRLAKVATLLLAL